MCDTLSVTREGAEVGRDHHGRPVTDAPSRVPICNMGRDRIFCAGRLSSCSYNGRKSHATEYDDDVIPARLFVAIGRGTLKIFILQLQAQLQAYVGTSSALRCTSGIGEVDENARQ